MEARSAEVSRAAWMPHGEDIHDPGVALDMASTIETSAGCAVLRVYAEPASSRLFRGVVGDWLCQSSRPGENVLVPRGGWEGAPGRNGAYLRGMEQIDAWEMCPVGLWMIRELRAVGAPPATAVIAGCASVASLSSMPDARLNVAAVDAVRRAAERGLTDAVEVRRAVRAAGSHMRDVVRRDDREDSTPEWDAAAASFQLARAALAAVEVAAGSEGGWTMGEFWRELTSAVDTAEQWRGGGPSADAIRDAVAPCDFLRARVGLPAEPRRG